MIEGYDLSKYQDPTPDLSGKGFVILRASIATTTDTMYATHYANARAAGVIVMAYHYLYGSGEVSIQDQANLFLDVAKDADFLWVDQERSGATDEDTQAFIDLVRKVRPCGLYHSACGFGGVNADAKWVADWRSASVAAGYPRSCDGSKEFPGWDLWQYNGGGADKIDNDRWNPASPIAALLRRGYVTEYDYQDVQGQLALCQRAHDALVTVNTELVAKVDALTADLAAAPAIERDRIAQAEAERIRAL